MIFAALVAVPAASFLCGGRYLPFFCLFPVAAAAELNFRYFRNIALLAFAPLLFLVWAILTGNGVTTLRSLRWIAALAAGSYFAGALGTSGIACVLKKMGSVQSLRTLSETMETAGPAIRVARETWNRNTDLPVLKRVSRVLSESLAAQPENAEPGVVKAVPVAAAAVSWLFLLGAVSGRLR